MPVSFSGIRSTTSINVQQGGTGNSELTSGSLLVGNGTDPIAFIPPGSEGQILTVVDGEWTAADNSGGGGGGGGLSSITTSGNLQGNGTSGSPATLKASISLTSVTASFSGSGVGLTGLSASQIGGLQALIDSRITNIPNSALQNSSVTINGQAVSLGGSTNIPVGLVSISTSGNIQGDGSGSAVTLKDNITLVSVTASFSGSGANLSGLSTSQLSDFNSSVDARITNIPNSALQNSSITVNGSAVSLGGSVTMPTSSANPSFTSVTAATGTINNLTVDGNLTVNGTQTIVNTTDLTITDNVILIASGAANSAQLDGAGIHFGRLPSEDARIIYDSVNDWMEIYPAVSASEIRGKLIGDGSSITNILNAALQNSSITINGSAVSLGGSVTVADSSTMTFTGSGFVVGNIVAMSGSLVLADFSDSMKSNAIGAVSAVSGTTVTVKVFGEVTATSASLVSAIGTPMYVGPSGSVVQYSGITSGKFITQVGYISPSSGKVVLQPRVFGQLA